MEARQKVVIVGAGGHGREISDIFAASSGDDRRYEVVGYIVEAGHGLPGALVNGKPILGDFDWLGRNAREVQAICGVGAPELRLRLAGRARAAGVEFCRAVHPTVTLTPWIAMGHGVVVAAGCVLTNQVRIGDHVHINIGCTVSHDTALEAFSYLAPGVHVTGKVAVGEGAYIGAGATVADGRTVGAWSIVGAGAVVVDDVPPNTTVVGVPARVIKRRRAGWQKAS